MRLVLPVCVTPFVKRQKNGAEAIAGAALRPTMRYVSVKSAAQQAQSSGIVFRTRNLFIRQRAQWVNALRGRLTEYGTIIAQGRVQFRRLMVNFDETAPDLPEPDLSAPVQGLRWFRNCAACTLSRYPFLMKRSGVSIQHRAKTDEGTSRLMTIFGVGPMCATPIQAFSPQMEAFANGPECAAWCGCCRDKNRPVAAKSFA